MSLGSGAPAASSLVPCGRAARAPGPHSTPSAPDTESCLPVVTVRSPLLLGWWQECHPLCPVAPCFQPQLAAVLQDCCDCLLTGQHCGQHLAELSCTELLILLQPKDKCQEYSNGASRLRMQ
jgi:hypothetical protein